MTLHPGEYLIVDIASAPIADVADYLEEPSPPANYKDPEKITAWIAEKKRSLADSAALDPDLGQITALGLSAAEGRDTVTLCHNEAAERDALIGFAALMAETPAPILITFCGHRFDLPFLVRRAAYLGVPLRLDVDRYRSPHIDLSDLLTVRGTLTAHSLAFYACRLGWDLVKPLTGAEEARVLESGQWDLLGQSVRHDLIATRRLAAWLGAIA